METLRMLGSPETIKFKSAKFGINTDSSFGVFQKDLNLIAKDIGYDDKLALELFATKNYDARILSSKIINPKNVTSQQMDLWIKEFNTWEICDSFCMKVFARTTCAIEKALEWTTLEPEFEKRAGFATIAAYCMADKKATNEVFDPFFDVILRESWDNRIYVKKAISWALRNIGKRNLDLKERAIEVALNIAKNNVKAAQWISKDVLNELTKDNLRSSDYPRAIYRPK